MDLNAIMEFSRELLSRGASTDDLLAKLREKGCSKIDSMKFLMQLKGLPLSEAKRAVHLSKAWESDRERDDAFHQALEDGLATGE